MRKMKQKVFKGATFNNGKQVAVVVAASSQRNAVAALHEYGLNVTIRELATYWSVTGNKIDCETALAQPGQVFIASTLEAQDYKPLPHCPLVKPSTPPEPKIPKDPEGKKLYDKSRRIASNTSKRQRGEVHVNAWLPPEAVEALNKLTSGSRERGAIKAALVLALTTCAAQQGA